ncbi:M48 family metalloprotease [Clostridium ganghwense]|uniref:M48 family metalloprotease n=1 Tax=Clostridium ganghwense TaxID=312089 RepID=A0ABT4CT93_9CLOT|nr:M48 family metalloprotease [Clostridium ganghwense]MCY6371653.1 M48 family metalloprotease [Clostridium ganghwense]
MFEFLFNLTIEQVVMINVILIAINLLSSVFIKKRVKTKYNKTQSVEEALYLQQKLSKYIQILLLVITSFISALTITPHTDSMGKLGIFVVMGVCFINMIVILIGSQLILYKTNQFLRKTTATRKEQIGMLIRFLIFSIIPMMIMFTVIIMKPDNFNIDERFEKYIHILIPAAVYLLITFIMPFFYKYMFKAEHLNDLELHDNLLSFVRMAGINRVKMFLWPTKNNRHANALVAGLIRKDIYVSDYLLENFTLEETQSILAHEIGHIKKHHLWIRTGLILGFIIIFPLLGEAMEMYEEQFSEISIWVGLLIFLSIFVLYFIVLRHYISRVQERQADTFVLDIGVEPLVYISALYKLAKLNNVVFKFGKLDEKFQTHPSIVKRIRWMMEQGNISEDEIEFILTVE